MAETYNQNLFGLTSDYSTTGVGDGDVRVFLELDDGTGLNEAPPDDQVPEDRLLEVPQVVSDDSYFPGATDTVVRLTNDDGRFTDDTVFIGTKAQLWDCSNNQQRLVISGRVSSQKLSPEELSLTISDIPIESLEHVVPNRKLNVEDHPTTQSAGSYIPLVFGRVLRHRCNSLGQGYQTTVRSDVDSDTIPLESVKGIAIGDRIAVGLLTERYEVLRVSSVDVANRRVTVTSHDHNHEAGETVANYDHTYDYVLGEGRLRVGANQFTFQSVEKVYHREMALNEEVVNTPGTLSQTGTVTFPLNEERLTRPLERLEGGEGIPENLPINEWYQNFVIDFRNDSGDILESYRIDSYNKDTNSVVFHRMNNTPLDFTSFRLREYRFFDGSQDYPYPGVAFIRFARKRTGPIHASCTGFEKTNPFDFVEALFRDTVWGAGDDSLTFLPNERVIMNDYKIEGVIETETKISSLIEEIAKLYPVRLTSPRGNPLLRLKGRDDAGMETATKSLADVGPGDFTQSMEIDYHSIAERVSRVKVNYRFDSLNRDSLSITSDDDDAFTLPEEGTELVINLPLVYSEFTADRVLYREAKKAELRVKTATLGVELSSTLLGLKVGDPVTLGTALVGGEGQWEVRGIDELCGATYGLTLVPWVARSYPNDRNVQEPEDVYSPETDFSQEAPDKVPVAAPTTNRKLDATGKETVEINTRWTPASNNYGGARVYFKESTDGDELLQFAGRAYRSLQFPVPKAGVEYTVRVVPLSEDGLTEGEPTDVTITPPADAVAPPQPNPAPVASVVYRSMVVKLAAYVKPNDFRYFEWELHATNPAFGGGIQTTVGLETIFEIPTTAGNDVDFKARVRAVDTSGNASDWSNYSNTINPQDIEASAGADGAGWETIYTTYTSAILPANRYPDNSWRYEQPGTRGGQVWTTHVPNLTRLVPFLFEARRKVEGLPAVGDNVSVLSSGAANNWRNPSLISHYSSFNIDDIADGGIPWNKIGGVAVTESQISAPVIYANRAGFAVIAAGIANIIQLNADRITGGIVDIERLSADVKNVDVLFNGYRNRVALGINVGNNTDGNWNRMTEITLAHNFKDYRFLEFTFIVARNGAENQVITALFPTFAVNIRNSGSDWLVLDYRQRFDNGNLGNYQFRGSALINTNSTVALGLALITTRPDGIKIIPIRSSNNKLKIWRSNVTGVQVYILSILGIRGAGASDDTIKMIRMTHRTNSGPHRIEKYRFGEFISATDWQTSTSFLDSDYED